MPGVIQALRKARKQLKDARRRPTGLAVRAWALGDGQMLGNAQAGEDAPAFRNIGEAGAGAKEGRVARGVAAVDPEAATARRNQAYDRADECRLAHAVATHEPDALARADSQRNAAQDVALAIVNL